MCYGCWEEHGKPEIYNEQTARASQLVASLYEDECVGGAAHIVTDDWNLEDDHVQWCLDNLNTYYDTPQDKAKAVLEAFLAMSIEERAAALALNHGFISSPR